MRLLHGALALALGSFVSSIAACSTAGPEPAEEVGETSNSQTGPEQCGSYPQNPACDTQLFVLNLWRDAVEDPHANLIVPAGEAMGCLKGLAEAAAIVLGGEGTPPAIVSAGGVIKTLTTAGDCMKVVELLHRSGIADNISCFMRPNLYDKNIHLCECRNDCKSGLRSSGTGAAAEPPQVFRYGYLGGDTTLCFCTDDPKEVACGWHCEDGWASSAPDNCHCR